MHSLLAVLLASFCSAGSSFCIRKNAEYSSSSNGYLFIHYVVSFLLSFAIYPEIWSTPWSPMICAIGAITGLFIVLLMQMTSRAITRGPAGLTFAFLNASSIFPASILFLVFGKDFGFHLSLFQVIGMSFVALGLFMAAKKQLGGNSVVTKEWVKYALACFLLQTLILTMFKWRCLSFTCEIPHALIPKGFTAQDDFWFMPGVFGMASIAQGVLLLKNKNKMRLIEGGFGTLGGIANGGSTALLLLAAQWAASPMENVLLFPLFAVSTIILCNLWANRFYHEKFHILPNAMCCVGIFVSALT